MNIAIIGCGFIAQTHIMVLCEMGYTVTICVDEDIKIAHDFAKKWGIKQYSDDFTGALEMSIDAVHICTPPALHYEMIKNSLKAGKHVICEKPLCLKDDEAQELCRIAAESKLVNAVGFNVRYHLPCIEISKLVKSPEFGNIYLIHGSYLQDFHAFPAPYNWRYDEALAGKMRAVTEIGSHWFDLAQTLSGRKIVAISATFKNFFPERFEVKVDSEDVAIIQLKFEGGAAGSVVLSEISQGRLNRLSIEITGEHANLWWDSENNNALYKGKKNEGVICNTNPFGNGFADTHRLLFKEVYADIESGVPSSCPDYPVFIDGERIVRLCNAAYLSAKNDSMWVFID